MTLNPDALLFLQARRAMRKCEDEDVLKIINEITEINFFDKQKWTLLTLASSLNRIKLAQWLIDRGAKIDTVEDYEISDSPLSIAAKKGHFYMVKLLVLKGANIKLHVGNWQCTAECSARLSGHHDISEFLLYQER